VQRPREFLRQKSLNALLGPSKGTLGKAALPAKSPFELKNGTVGEDGRAAKRQRMDAQAIWAVTRVTTPAKATKSKEKPLRARMTDARAKAAHTTQPARKAAPKIAGQMSLKVKEVIDITSENDDNTSSDIVLIDSSPLDPNAISSLQPRRTPAVPRSQRSDSPLPPNPTPEPRSPPVSTTNRITNIDANMPPGILDITDIDRGTGRCPSPRSGSRLKPIKLTKSKPRNMLLCEKDNPKFLKTKAIPRARTKEQMVPSHDLMDQQLLPIRELPTRATEQATVRPAFVAESRETGVCCRIQSGNDTATSFPVDDFRGSSMVNEELLAPAFEGLSAAKHALEKRQSTSETVGARNKVGGTAQASVVLSEQLETKRTDQEKGPWTVEALDFFDWRPPDWDARVKQNASELEGRA
jgi:hypothetical protein